MKWLKPRFIIVLLLALLITSVAWAHRGGYGHGHRSAHVGIVVGVPLAGTWHYPYYPYYPYYHAPAVTYGPVYYVEQGSDQQTQGWWYYCTSAQGYYPYIKACPEGWQRVTPQPPDLR
ncbi:MAG: hypothetical protein ACREX0_04505 [Noviherbaspirillum sp.]